MPPSAVPEDSDIRDANSRKMYRQILLFIAVAVLLGACASTRQQTAAPAKKGGVQEHVLYYTSVDQHGDSLTLSGKIYMPEHPKGIILLPHYTIASNDEVPSTGGSGEERFLCNDYVLIMPDYIGYGVTRDRVHPYLHGELTARNTVDMLLASRAAVDSMLQATTPACHLTVDTISVVGFSQGGATALWVLKLLEQNYADRVHVTGCYAGSGPYDVAATYDVAVAENKVGMPMVIPMLVMGTSAAYDLHLQREQFFTPELDKHYDDYVTSKTHTFPELYLRMLNHKVSHWLTAYGADKTQPETRRMYEGLLRSSLVHYPLDSCEVGQQVICPEWRPVTPVYILHSYNDPIVTFRCAEHLQRCWQDLPNVTYDFGDYGGHMRSSKVFFSRVKERLAQ